MQWFYLEGQEQKGPFEDPEFARLQTQGLIQDHTLVFSYDMKDWMPLSQARAQGFWSGGAPDSAPAAASASSDQGMVACPSCGTRVWENELIPLGDRMVCIHCRDVTLQKIREGVNPLADNVRYAGFGIRFAGVFIDGLIVQLYSWIVNIAFGLAVFSPAMETLDRPLWIAYMILSAGLPLLYPVFFIGHPRFQATLGMMAVKIKAVRPDGSRIGYWRSLGRELASYISAILLGIGYFMMLSDSENRTLHDRMADTRVVYK